MASAEIIPTPIAQVITGSPLPYQANYPGFKKEIVPPASQVAGGTTIATPIGS